MTGTRTHEMSALHELSRLGEARAAHVRLRQLADELGAPLYADYAEALVNGDGAVLASAAAGFAAAGALPMAAEAYRRAATGYVATGRLARAGAARLLARELLDRCPGAVAPPADPAPAVPLLTAREREIALLAADGWSDRAIAERLSLSVRTVQNHLHRTYAKVQVSGRRELTALLIPG